MILKAVGREGQFLNSGMVHD